MTALAVGAPTFEEIRGMIERQRLEQHTILATISMMRERTLEQRQMVSVTFAAMRQLDAQANAVLPLCPALSRSLRNAQVHYVAVDDKERSLIEAVRAGDLREAQRLILKGGKA